MHLTYEDAHKDGADTGTGQLEDDEPRFVFILDGRRGPRRYVPITPTAAGCCP
ncbi:MAG TPA: hypothetical protein VIC82_01615 [Candidatus Nanopelagicales bacterium]